MQTVTHRSGVTRDEHGKFVAQFTLTYETTNTDGKHTQVRRQLPAQGVETVGRVINRMGDRGEAWNIRVTDAGGQDVTQEFACFQD